MQGGEGRSRVGSGKEAKRLTKDAEDTFRLSRPSLFAQLEQMGGAMGGERGGDRRTTGMPNKPTKERTNTDVPGVRMLKRPRKHSNPVKKFSHKQLERVSVAAARWHKHVLEFVFFVTVIVLFCVFQRYQ